MKSVKCRKNKGYGIDWKGSIEWKKSECPDSPNELHRRKTLLFDVKNKLLSEKITPTHIKTADLQCISPLYPSTTMSQDKRPKRENFCLSKKAGICFT